MPETALQKTQTRDSYLNQNRSVNIQKQIDEQKKIKDSGLEGIEIRKTNKQLGKDDFLKLLITQLTHQDPTAPVKDQAFIAQMAQFSSLEQMKNMSSTLKSMSEKQSGNLVGKFVIGKDHLSGEQVSGVAQAMFYDKAGDAFFKVGGRVVRVNDITLVGKPEMFKKEFGGTAKEEVKTEGGQVGQNHSDIKRNENNRTLKGEDNNKALNEDHASRKSDVMFSKDEKTTEMQKATIQKSKDDLNQRNGLKAYNDILNGKN